MRVAALLLLLATVTVQGAEPDWAEVREGGHVIMLRHAIAPGGGDPPEFELGDCSTQRNLSEAGHRQARAIGARLRELGFGDAPVHTSRWCRCRDTARELGLAEPEDLPALDSFFSNRDRAEPQMRALRAFLQRHRDGPTRVLVTHQVNVTAATNVFPASGEGVVARIRDDGLLDAVGRLPPP